MFEGICSILSNSYLARVIATLGVSGLRTLLLLLLSLPVLPLTRFFIGGYIFGSRSYRGRFLYDLLGAAGAKVSVGGLVYI